VHRDVLITLYINNMRRVKICEQVRYHIIKNKIETYLYIREKISTNNRKYFVGVQGKLTQHKVSNYCIQKLFL
jgi:hypothetical protein